MLMMKFVIFGDIHDCIDRVEMIFSIAKDIFVDVSYALITGDYGEKNESVLRVAKIIRENGIIGISTYGNHEPEIIRKAVKNAEITNLNGIRLLSLGARCNLGDITILGLGGNRGSGKKWSHWRDHQVERIIDMYKGDKIDIILSHEMPYGLADICRGNKHCGQLVLRRVVDELNPIIFIGGHLHTFPNMMTYKDSIILKVGGISNRGALRDVSFFSILEWNKRIRMRIYRLNVSEEKVSEILIFTP